jgi:hypothetical protein
VLPGIPISLEQAAGPQLPRHVSDLTRALRCFFERGRIGKLQMQRDDLRMENVATV